MIPSLREMDGGSETGMLRGERLRSFTALAGGVAHELNNILATVLMSVDVLRLSSRQGPEGEVLAALAETVRRGLHTTRQLQWLAAGADDEVTLFQPRFLISDLQQLLRATSPASLAVVTEYPPDLWLLHGDPLVVYQLLLALLLAGREALAGRGTLRLAARNEELAVTPAGCGAPPGPYLVIEVTAAHAAATRASKATATRAANATATQAARATATDTARAPLDGKRPVPRSPVPSGAGMPLAALVRAAGGYWFPSSPAAAQQAAHPAAAQHTVIALPAVPPGGEEPFIRRARARPRSA